MSPLRFLLLTIITLLTFIFFPLAFSPQGWIDSQEIGTLRAEESPGQDPPLEEQKLDLEVKELRHRLSAWGKVERNAPFIAGALAFIGAVVGAVLTFRSRNKELRLNTITNLKRELASENPSIRIAAVHALADYPKEAIPTLIASLGSIKPIQGGSHSKIEEDTAFTSTVAGALVQIGGKAVDPCINELRRIQGEIRHILIIGEDEKVRQLYKVLPFAIFNEFSEGTEAVRNGVEKVAWWNGINLDDEEISRVVKKLGSTVSSRFEAVVANKNGIWTLAYLLRTHSIKRLILYDIDLSGADLRRANLSNAYLGLANLSNADLQLANLSGANLEGAYLSGVILFMANLSGADLWSAELRHADLWMADLSGAILHDVDLGSVKRFRGVKDFSKADLRGVKGLSKEDLEYAKSKGAIIDEPATQEKPKEPAE